MNTYYTDRHRRHATDSVVVNGQPLETSEVPARAEILRRAAQAFGPIREPADFGETPLTAVHQADFVEFQRTIFAEWAGRYPGTPVLPETIVTRGIRRRSSHLMGRVGYHIFGTGTPILAGTWEAAYWAAQCALSAADDVRAGARAAYAVCRPPGPHAGADYYGGYCHLNNAAIAARHLQAAEGQPGARGPAGRRERVAVLDIDYHHGNGTQSIFYADPSVLYVSLHADPDLDYPYYWGGADERGEGAGEGFNLNVPLPLGTGDGAYLEALAVGLRAIAEFAPSRVIVSAGFDIARGDPVGGFEVTTAGLRAIGAQIAGLNLPTVIVQEGGYLLERLEANAAAFLSAFA